MKLSVLRIDGATIDDPHLGAGFLAIGLDQEFADGGVHLDDIVHACGLAAADRPDRFIGDGQPLYRVFDIGGERCLELAQHVFGRLARFALVQRFAAAKDDLEPGFERGCALLGDQLVLLAMAFAPFAVAQDDEARARIGYHRCGDVAGMRAAIGGMAILRTDTDLLGLAADRVNEGERRGESNLDLHQTLRSAVNRARFGQHRARAVHFPVANDERAARHFGEIPVILSKYDPRRAMAPTQERLGSEGRTHSQNPL